MLDLTSETKTERCIWHQQRPAVVWTGHVIHDNGTMRSIAGFCSAECKDARTMHRNGLWITFGSRLATIPWLT